MQYEYPLVWPFRCKTCEVKGSWDQWTKEIPLTIRDGVARGSVFLKPNDYEFKFIVDGVWKVNPHSPAIRNSAGHDNHFIKSHEFIFMMSEPTCLVDCSHLRCKVCHDQPVQTWLVPCGHVVMCKACSNKIAKCPVCRKAYQKDDIKMAYLT
jgi:hypothetical protein